jgi:exopolysaccharide biosynthesis protein
VVLDGDLRQPGQGPRVPGAAAHRAALRLSLAVACDGRADDEAGLTIGELAEAMAALGAMQAMNLNGGGSTSLVFRRR